jgi:hypothetical protein
MDRLALPRVDITEEKLILWFRTVIVGDAIERPNVRLTMVILTVEREDISLATEILDGGYEIDDEHKVEGHRGPPCG